MIRWVTTGARIGLVVAAMAVIVPMVTFAQTSSPATESEPAASGHASPVQAASGPEDNTSVETNLPARSTIPSEIEVERQSRFNDLRREVLDDRAKLVDWWLAATAIFLTLLGIVAVIAGYLSFKRFREIEAEARQNVTASQQYTEEARHLVEEIKAKRHEAESLMEGLNAQIASDDPGKATQAILSVRQNPGASLTGKAIADAISLQQQGRTKEAIEKWQVIANLAEGTDNDLAARALFSVGYLLQGEDLKRSISAYNEAILLKPDLYEAYNNRGNVKLSSGQHEAAIIDFGEAINLKPDFAVAYNNRGSANAALGRHEAAIADFDETIRLKSDFAEAFNNRGNAKFESGRHEAAIADFNEAIHLKPDYAGAYINRGIAKVKLNLKDEARKDFEIALTLPRNAEDTGLQTKAEKWLRDLDAAEGS